MKRKGPSGQVCANAWLLKKPDGNTDFLRITQQRTRSTRYRSQVISAPFCLSPYKDHFQSHCTLPVCLTSAHQCNSTGISTLNSLFLCLLWQQLQTGTEKLKLEQRLLYISYFVSHICAYRKKKSHIPHSKKLCFTKLGRNFLRSSLFR